MGAKHFTQMAHINKIFGVKQDIFYRLVGHYSSNTWDFAPFELAKVHLSEMKQHIMELKIIKKELTSIHEQLKHDDTKSLDEILSLKMIRDLLIDMKDMANVLDKLIIRRDGSELRIFVGKQREMLSQQDVADVERLTYFNRAGEIHRRFCVIENALQEIMQPEVNIAYIKSRNFTLSQLYPLTDRFDGNYSKLREINKEWGELRENLGRRGFFKSGNMKEKMDQLLTKAMITELKIKIEQFTTAMKESERHQNGTPLINYFHDQLKKSESGYPSDLPDESANLTAPP